MQARPQRRRCLLLHRSFSGELILAAADTHAGLQKDANFHDMSLAEWNHVIAINLTGQFLCAREAIKEFLRRGDVRERSLRSV